MDNTLNQSHYGRLEIDNSEKDMVQVWNYDPRKPKSDPQVVFIERDKVEQLFEMIKEANKQFFDQQTTARKDLPGWPEVKK